MSIRIATAALAAAALGAGVATGAAAVTGPQQVTAVFTGEVDPIEGVDTLGEFGVPGANIGGLPLTATFTVNERNPNLFSVFNPSGSTPDVSEYIGLVSADLSIDGEDVQLPGLADPFSLVLLSDNGLGYGYLAQSEAYVPLTNNIGLSKTLSLRISIPLHIPTTPDYHSYALSGDVWNPVPTGSGFRMEGSYTITSNSIAVPLSETLGLISDSLTVTTRSAPWLPALVGARAAVPEPATWATMLLGLGGLGALARRRRGAVRAA
jgi:hypothetical protein